MLEKFRKQLRKTNIKIEQQGSVFKFGNLPQHHIYSG